MTAVGSDQFSREAARLAGYGKSYAERYEELTRYEAECGRLREQLDALKRQQWSNQNRAEVAERGHKAALARDFEQRDTIKRLREQLDAEADEWEAMSRQHGATVVSRENARVWEAAARRLRAALGVVGEQK